METSYATRKVFHDPAQAKMLGRIDYPLVMPDLIGCDCAECLDAYTAGWNEAYMEHKERTT